MIQTVVKRDGRIVGFNREKIAAAIRKAMLTTEAVENEVLVYKIVDRIEFRDKEQSSVEVIQDMVELELMSTLRKEFAKSYIMTKGNVLSRIQPSMVQPLKILHGCRDKIHQLVGI